MEDFLSLEKEAQVDQDEIGIWQGETLNLFLGVRVPCTKSNRERGCTQSYHQSRRALHTGFEKYQGSYY